MRHKVTLDINPDPKLDKSSAYYEKAKLLENGLIECIHKASNVNNFNPNYLVVGYLVAEKIMDCSVVGDSFKLSSLNLSLQDIGLENKVREIGNFIGYKVYVDPHMDKNMILIKYNKQSMRDNKLEAILEDVKELEIVEINLIGGI
jgi:hypothetical protein